MNCDFSLGAGSPWLACLLVLAALAHLVQADTEHRKSLEFIEKIFGYLNNDQECTLPTFEQVEELQRCFKRLEAAWGAGFEARLTADQKLVRETILSQWDFFERQMTSSVTIRSAKKRFFLCKIEAYQKAKFGHSICTRLHDIRGPITDQIFERNPLVRYLKHLETGAVFEQPPESVSEETGTTSTTMEAPVIESPEPREEVTPASAPAKPEAKPEPGSKPAAESEPVAELEQGPKPAAGSEPVVKPGPAAEPAEGKEEWKEEDTEAEGLVEDGDEEDEEDDEAGEEEREEEASQSKDKRQGIQHTPIGMFTIELADELVDRARAKFGQRKEEFNRDPLDDIPVPSSDDAGAPEVEVKQEAKSEGASVPKTDEFGAEYVDEQFDGAQLERLARAPKRDWAFDPVYGYFKWPDECNADLCPASQQLDDSMLALDGAWFQFLADPYAYHAHLEGLKPLKTTTPRPKINAKWLKQQKALFNQAGLDEARRDRLFGWNNANTPAKIYPPYMPEIKRDRWKNLADNNFCKISYNTDYLSRQGKKGMGRAKKFFGSAKRSTANFREHLLASRPAFASIRM